jgi:hypothetical protein
MNSTDPSSSNPTISNSLPTATSTSSIHRHSKINDSDTFRFIGASYKNIVFNQRKQ